MTQPTSSFRMQRVERLLQRRVAELIRSELKDPRLEMVNITHIDVSKDLSVATIYITLLSDEKSVQKENVAILNKSAGHLRHCLATDSTWRTLPRLRFKYDDAFERSQHLVGLLEKLADTQKKH